MRLQRWHCHHIDEDLRPITECIDSVADLLREGKPVMRTEGVLNHLMELAEVGAVHVKVDALV